jgi:hypothetical protein
VTEHLSQAAVNVVKIEHSKSAELEASERVRKSHSDKWKKEETE